ncbi:unnamed protein product [Parnassius mnemosyne]|uniref:Uncharacterized protein n=1 Tax=Parnassius mnemosyne TaxID=213953 RepID=A0AAV1KH32_9NEOP
MEEGKKSKVSMQVLKSQSATREPTDFGPKSISRLRVRRTSFGFTGVPGIKPVDRTSQLALEYRRPPLIYLNTYQLEPNNKFDVYKVKKITDQILDECFTDHKYHEQESPTLAMRIAGEVMRKIKSLSFNRYRIITVVTIGQKRSQSYNNAVAFIWDHERDNYADVMREVSSAFIQITSFGIYLD